jgi:hypothetical protein
MFRTVFAPIILLAALLIPRVHAQDVRGYYGVFEDYQAGRFVMRTPGHSMDHWVADAATQFEGERPAPGAPGRARPASASDAAEGQPTCRARKGRA